MLISCKKRNERSIEPFTGLALESLIHRCFTALDGRTSGIHSHLHPFLR